MRLLALLDVNLSLTPPEEMTVTKKMRNKRRDLDEISFAHDDVVEQTIEYTHAARYQTVWVPEVLVAMGLVMVMKMAYGLDGETR